MCFKLFYNQLLFLDAVRMRINIGQKTEAETCVRDFFGLFCQYPFIGFIKIGQKFIGRLAVIDFCYKSFFTAGKKQRINLCAAAKVDFFIGMLLAYSRTSSVLCKTVTPSFLYEGFFVSTIFSLNFNGSPFGKLSSVFLPTIMIFPFVFSLKNFISAGMWYKAHCPYRFPMNCLLML